MTALAAFAAAAALTLAAPPEFPPPGVVSPDAAKAVVAAGATVVDVRTPAEFEAGHVKGAINIPFDQMAARAGEVGKKDRPVVIYCRSGRRSGIAGEELRKQGFTAVYDFQAFSGWTGETATGK
jgi:phage shock protein E